MENPTDKMREKPIDRWLGAGGMAVGLGLFLLPKTPRTIASCLVLIFVLLIHPLWNFWWIEDKLRRRVIATLVFIVGLIYLGQLAWPPESLGPIQVSTHFVAASWHWLIGPHGRWFDRFLGAVATIVILTVLALLGRAFNARQVNTKNAPNKGFLDYKSDAETAMVEMPKLLSKLTTITSEVGPAIDGYTRQLLVATSTAQQLKACKIAATGLDRYSRRVDAIRYTFVKNGNLLTDGLMGWSRWLQHTSPEKKAFETFPDTLRQFVNTLSTSNCQLSAYIASIVAAKGASSVLDEALDRHINSWEFILQTNKRIHDSCSEILRVIDSFV